MDYATAGITEKTAHRAAEILRILHDGNRNRTVDSHKLNDTSSRSHAVLQLQVDQYEHTVAGLEDSSAPEAVPAFVPTGYTLAKSAKLALIDLAGSERAHKTQTNKKMRREGAEINKSLLALSNCINALSQSTSGKKGLYIPFRDSKLTRLLKDSLIGLSRTYMIANVSPGSSQWNETRETLIYAYRATHITAQVCIELCACVILCLLT